MTAPTYPYDSATEAQRVLGSWWWCVHHEIHLEPLTEPIENRVEYIREYKPKHEVDCRLRELAPVLHPERLPKRLLEAWAEYYKAWAEYYKARAEYDKEWAEYAKAGAEYAKARYAKAWAEYNKAWAEYAKAVAEYEPELMALHREEYPETKWNGKTIFPKESR